jgi:cobalamin biosynthesis Mg chelatase CobN
MPAFQPSIGAGLRRTRGYGADEPTVIDAREVVDTGAQVMDLITPFVKEVKKGSKKGGKKKSAPASSSSSAALDKLASQFQKQTASLQRQLSDAQKPKTPVWVWPVVGVSILSVLGLAVYAVRKK